MTGTSHYHGSTQCLVAPTYSTTTGQVTMPPAGSNPASIVAASYGDIMLCRNGSLPVGFKGSSNGGLQLP